MTRMSWSELPHNERYELWDARCTYGCKGRFYVRFVRDGVTITDRPFQSETRARDTFERLSGEKAVLNG